jgi:F-type H+-transporting ATPase subunit alpha
MAELTINPQDITEALRKNLEGWSPSLEAETVGYVTSIGDGVARVKGLPAAMASEILEFPGGLFGVALNLDEDSIGAVVMGEASQIQEGDPVRQTRRVLSVPVGDALLGRVVDALGNPVDGKGPIDTSERRLLETQAPSVVQRQPVNQPLQTGIKAIDAMTPIGRGQRQLIIGDRSTGKTAIAVDTIINQRGLGVKCIYVAIGQKASTVAEVAEIFEQHGAMEYTVIVNAPASASPALQMYAPYAGSAIGQHWMYDGEHALVIFDDLSKQAVAYREISLLLRRPPGREAYPGDIFYVHSRMLERSTHLTREAGGGSLTALPIIETQAQNISAYIPTNLISITDGQIYLSPDLFQKGVLPAVDVGRSVSRVGGEAQLPAYQAVAGDLRLAYSQFEELESFARFGTRLDEETRHTLERGRRVREVFKQPQSQPIPAPEQIAVLLVTTKGVFDQLPLDKIGLVAERLRQTFAEELPDHYQQIQEGKPLSDEAREGIVDLARHLIGQVQEEEHGND